MAMLEKRLAVDCVAFPYTRKELRLTEAGDWFLLTGSAKVC